MQSYKVVRYVLLIAVITIVLFPIYWLFRMSIVPVMDITTLPPKIFFKPSFESFFLIFKNYNIFKYISNSLVIALSTTAISLIIGLPAAYSFVRFEYRGKLLFSLSVLLLYVMPPMAMALPFYNIFMKLGLSGTIISLMLSHSIITIPLTVFLLSGFIASLPVELEHAAMIDGCTRVGSIIRVTIPLLLPGIGATAVLSFLYSWNDFIYASVLSSRLSKTTPLLIAGFITDKAIYWDRIASAGVIVLLPPLILGVLVQPFLVQGLSAGAVKG